MIQRHDGGVALADAEVSTMTRSKPAACRRRSLRAARPKFPLAGVARGERTHVDVRMLDGVHADAVAEQRTTGALARRVDGDDGNLQRVAPGRGGNGAPVRRSARTCRAAGAGNAEHRVSSRPPPRENPFLTLSSAGRFPDR